MYVLRTCLLGAVLALALVPSAVAEPQDDEQKARIQEYLAKIVPPLLSPEAVEKLKFSTEQKEKFEKLQSEYKEKAKEAVGKLKDAFQNKEREKIREALQGLRGDIEKVRNDSLAKVEAFLNDQQKKLFQEAKKEEPRLPGAPERRPGAGGAGLPGLPPGLADKLNLTEEQKKKIAEIQKEMEAKIMGVLTDEQKKQLEELRKQAPKRRPNP